MKCNWISVYRSLEVFHQHGKTHSELLKAQRTAGGCGLGGPLRYPNSIILWLRCNKVRSVHVATFFWYISFHIYIGEIDISVLLSQTDHMMYYQNNDGTIFCLSLPSRFPEHYFPQSVSVSIFIGFWSIFLLSENLTIMWTLGTKLMVKIFHFLKFCKFYMLKFLFLEICYEKT